MKLTSLVALTMALAIVAPVRAETITLDAAGIQADAPKDWKTKKDADSMTFDAPDGSVSAVFQLLPAKSEEEAIKAVEDSLDKALGKVKWGDKATSKEKINGLDAEIWNGTAKDGALQVEAIYLTTADGKQVGLYWFDTPESEKKFKADEDTIWKSIKPIEKK